MSGYKTSLSLCSRRGFSEARSSNSSFGSFEVKAPLSLDHGGQGGKAKPDNKAVRPPILAPCNICQMPDDETPKGIWFERYEEYLCASCGKEMLEYEVIKNDLMAQVKPVVEQWSDCWQACGVSAALLRDTASLMNCDDAIPAPLKAA